MNLLKGFTRKQIKVIIFLVLFLLAYGGVIGLYKIESSRNAADFYSQKPGADYIEAFVRVISIDPIKGDIAARIQFVPHGNLGMTGSNQVSKEVKFLVNSSASKPERVFEKGKIMEPADVVIPISEGQVSDYPFDRHKSFLELEMTSTANPPTKIPIMVHLWSDMAGFNTNAYPIPENTASYVGINITVERSITTTLFSIFIMLGMWSVGIIVLLQARIVQVKGDMVELGMFTYNAALIFALPAVRNIQPGIPPVGTLSDFMAFFWAEGLATVSFITIASCWLSRYGK